MNTELYERMILGHLVADFLLQSRTMALRKSEKSLIGLVWCLVHCLSYTLTIALFTWRFDPLFLLLVFVSHFPIDRWSLGSKWLKLIKGRDMLKAYESEEKYHEVDLAFSCIVYTIADNTLHLVQLWLISMKF